MSKKKMLVRTENGTAGPRPYIRYARVSYSKFVGRPVEDQLASIDKAIARLGGNWRHMGDYVDGVGISN